MNKADFICDNKLHYKLEIFEKFILEVILRVCGRIIFYIFYILILICS